ncbi:MAG: ABC transporter substrate-binding protein, partial [Candidatus Limivicinus sp.]|nr:ABC transporter substrate-binding protein [Candidatus Limivicinus sp.]
MKKSLISLMLCLAALFAMAACGAEDAAPAAAPSPDADAVELVDALGNRAVLSKGARVACGYASFAQCWLLSGGELVGVTQDAIDRGILSAGDAAVIGTVKSIDLEKLVSLSPDYVILSADLSAHSQLESSLDTMGIPYGYYRVDTFADYKAMMAQFCVFTGRDDLYQTNVLDVERNIEGIRARIPASCDKSVLLLRAYSTGIKAKTDDNLAGQILKEYGLRNIADESPSLLEDLSMEQVILTDPDFIFILTMGDEQAAAEYMRTNL